MIRLSRSDISELESKEVTRILLEDGYLGMGQEVKKFEDEIKLFLGTEMDVVCVNTGTSGLHLAAQAIGLRQGDEVLIPSLTYVACFQAVSATGATPIPCEIERKTCLLDLKDAEKKLSKKTKALMYVHYGSNPGNIELVYDFAKKHGLRVIEDAAHSFGCSYKGKKIGVWGDVVCFSFDGIKNITCGEGGAVTSSDKTVTDKIKDLRLLAVEKDTEKRFSGQRSWSFDVKEQGWRYHMSNLMAAIGRVQLLRFEKEFRPKRRKLSSIYRAELAKIGGIELFEWDTSLGTDIVPHIMPIKILNDKRDYLRARLIEKQIEVGLHYHPSHLLSKFNPDLHYTLPVTDTVYSELLTLPLHTLLSEKDVFQIISEIKEGMS